MKLLSVLKIIVFVTASTLVAATVGYASNSKKTKSIEEDLKPIRNDEKAAEIQALKTELLVAKTEAEAMKQLDRLLRKYRGTAMEASLWLRKAELYVRQSKT